MLLLWSDNFFECGLVRLKQHRKLAKIGPWIVLEKGHGLSSKYTKSFKTKHATTNRLKLG